jgi:hypothetical protein
MVLRDPGGIEAVLFGTADLLGSEPVALPRVHLIEKPGEEAEPGDPHPLCTFRIDSLQGP